MGFLSSLPLLSLGGGALGITVSVLLIAIVLALWALVLMILHPLHATMFIITASIEYLLIQLFGFDLYFNFISFFVIYVIIFAIYTLGLRRWLPLPQTEIEQLLKLAELKKQELISDEEYKAAKKKLLKI